MIREYIYFVDDNPNGTSGMTEEEIIRCKDCKHFDEENGVCKVDGNGGWQADDFCSTGERKKQ